MLKDKLEHAHREHPQHPADGTQAFILLVIQLRPEVPAQERRPGEEGDEHDGGKTVGRARPEGGGDERWWVFTPGVSSGRTVRGGGFAVRGGGLEGRDGRNLGRGELILRAIARVQLVLELVRLQEMLPRHEHAKEETPDYQERDDICIYTMSMRGESRE